MPDVDLPIPFESYAGNEPYIFASYAHKDGQAVFPVLQALHREGYRVWYDEGIDPGNEWADEIGKWLELASVFLVFISKQSVNSRNVRNEISFALELDKRFLAIHIENTTLPRGLRLRMGDIQAIMKWRMTEDHFSRKVASTLPPAVCGAPPKSERERPPGRAVADSPNLQLVNLAEVHIPASVVELMPESLARENVVIALGQEGGALKIAMSDPTDFNKMQKLQFILNKDIQPVLALRVQIMEAINRLYGQTGTESTNVASDFAETEATSDDEFELLEDVEDGESTAEPAETQTKRGLGEESGLPAFFQVTDPYCPTCGGRRTSDSGICSRCKQRIDLDPQTSETCWQMKCGHIMPPSFAFCTACGAKIDFD
jgi:hypothetical protein